MVRFCPRCWKENPPTAEVCWNCGLALGKLEASQAGPSCASILMRGSTASGHCDTGQAADGPARGGVNQATGDPEPSYEEKLLDALNHHPVPEIRVRAAWVLGEKRSKHAVPALCRILLHGGDPVLQRQAAESLGRIGATAATPALLQAATAENMPLPVRGQSVRALAEIGDQRSLLTLVPLLQARSAFLRREAQQALNRLGISGNAAERPSGTDSKAPPPECGAGISDLRDEELKGGEAGPDERGEQRRTCGFGCAP